MSRAREPSGGSKRGPEKTRSDQLRTVTTPGAEPLADCAAGLIDAVREAIVTIDEQQRIVMLNPAALRMFRCTAEEALGSDVARFIPARYRPAHDRHVRSFAASRENDRPMGVRNTIVGLRADGTEFPADAGISRLDVRDEYGARHYYAALLRDLSTEVSLRQSNEMLQLRMRTIFDLAPVAIWITDAEQIVYANRACAAVFGVEHVGALVGRSIFELVHPDSQASLRAKMNEALHGLERTSVVTERIRRIDGEERVIEIAVAALPDHGRSAVQMVLSDITERSLKNQELARSRRELRRLSASLVEAREEERRRLARELHDEFGQRLTALKMELSSLTVPSDAPAQRAQIDAMLEMIDETVAAVRRISTELRPSMLDDLGLNAAIEWLAEGWARRMGIAVKLDLGAEDPPVGEAASIALYRMVQEALTNVARHAGATEVRIGLCEEGKQLVLTVRDNGVGFAEPMAYREDSHGLMGMRERAYMLGGRLEVGNNDGGSGGQVRVHLPLQPLTPRTD